MTRQQAAAGVPAPNNVPFDWRPLGVVCYCLSVNAYTLASLLPYVGFMVADFQGVSGNSAGFIAGYVASSFTFGRLISSYFWGWAADRFGRKPVMIISMGSIALLSIVFGTSQSLAVALASRFTLGILNGAMSTGRALVPELAGKDRVVTAMSYVSGSKGMGMIFGPALGGLLAQPAKHYPTIFSSTGLFSKYPYLLPNVMGAILALISVPLVLFLIPETRHHTQARSPSPARGRPLYKVAAGTEPIENGEESVAALESLESGGRLATASPEKRLRPTDVPVTAENDTHSVQDNKMTSKVDTEPLLSKSSAYGTINGGEGAALVTASRANTAEDVTGDEEDEAVAKVCGKGGLLQTPNLTALLIMTAIFSAVVIGFEEALPLWALSSKEVGGLEWNTVQIGQTLGLAGIVVAFFQFVLYPWLTQKLGLMAVMKASGALAPLTYSSVPFVRYLELSDSQLIVILTVLLSITMCTNGALMQGMMLASVSPVPPHLRGKMGGLVIMSQSFGRTLGPACWATMYAWSISPNGGGAVRFVDFRFVFCISTVLMVLVSFIAWQALTLDSMTNVVGDARASSRASKTTSERSGTRQ